MSKLGLHVSAGKRNGFGPALERAAAAGSPYSVIQAVGQDVWPDVARYSPRTLVVYRTQADALGKPVGDAPADMYRGDPVQSARGWLARIMPVWRRNRAHYYAPINEQDGGPASDMDWLNAFLIECVIIAQANGFKLAGPNFSAGNPRDDSALLQVAYALLGHRAPRVVQRLALNRSAAMTAQAANGLIQPGSAEDRWKRLLPALLAFKAGGHLLTLHEYGLHFGTLQASAPYLATRYERVIAFLRTRNAVPAIVINECGNGVGGFTNRDRWLADLAWYDARLMANGHIIGACVYQLGGDENIVNGLPHLTDYVAAHPTPDQTPEPDLRVAIRFAEPITLTKVVDPALNTNDVVLSVGPDTSYSVTME